MLQENHFEEPHNCHPHPHSYFLPSLHTCYEGDCVNGQGTSRSIDGGKYAGEFKDGKQNGRGILISPDGSRKTGHWVLGEYVGE